MLRAATLQIIDRRRNLSSRAPILSAIRIPIRLIGVATIQNSFESVKNIAAPCHLVYALVAGSDCRFKAAGSKSPTQNRKEKGSRRAPLIESLADQTDPTTTSAARSDLQIVQSRMPRGTRFPLRMAFQSAEAQAAIPDCRDL